MCAEICWLIGEVYMTKASQYIKLHKKASSNILGIPAWSSRVKEKVRPPVYVIPQGIKLILPTALRRPVHDAQGRLVVPLRRTRHPELHGRHGEAAGEGGARRGRDEEP